MHRSGAATSVAVSTVVDDSCSGSKGSVVRGSRALGLTLVAGFIALVVACVPTPIQTPGDPDIPGQSTPAFPNLTDPPSTAGPTDPPVPTTDPGDFAYGDTVTIHTSQGSTWEITPTESIDPADDIMSANAYAPSSGNRFVILELEITNVGVVDTHPYFDVVFGYQPDHGPVYAQNSASMAAAPDDIGYEYSVSPGQTITGQVVVQVPASAEQGSWIISGDNRTTIYRFR